MVFKKIVLALLIFAIVVIAGCNSKGTLENDDQVNTLEENTNLPPTQNTQSEKAFTLTGKNFKFVRDNQENPDLVVNQGDKVKITFSVVEGFHDFVIDELNAKTTQLKAGDQETSIEFIADKKGTFEYYCSVGSHRENGMKGKFIVE